MTAPIKPGALRLDPLGVFIALASARAMLWQAGKMDLHEAVDELQAVAVTSGLVKRIGQDAVQRIMAAAFAPVRDDTGPTIVGPADTVPDPLPEPSPVEDIPTSIRRAAEYLIRKGDRARLRAWLDRHSPHERDQILQHLESKKRRAANG